MLILCNYDACYHSFMNFLHWYAILLCVGDFLGLASPSTCPALPTVRAAYERYPSSRLTALAPRRLGIHPPLYFGVIYRFQYLPHLLPPPSELNLGRVIRRLDRIETVVQSIGLIVELPSRTHGPTPARTWTGRIPRLTLLGASQEFQRRRSRW